MSDELTNHLHAMSSLEIVELMNEQDSTIAEVVQDALPEIAQAVDLISKKGFSINVLRTFELTFPDNAKLPF